MKTKLPLGITFLGAILLISLPFSYAQMSCGNDNALCGPQSLLVVCDKLEVKTNLEELEALSGYEAKTGTTMLGLKTAAKAKGLQAVGMKIGVDELVGLKIPAIAHLWDNHFVVIEAGDSGMLKVTDPPAEPKMVSNEDFKKAYSGFALLIAKDAGFFPKSEASGPDIRFDGYAWDFGSIYEGELAYHTFKARNAGKEDLLISKMDSSCTCLTLLDSGQKISPGGEGEIKVVFDSTGLESGQSKYVYVTSNDPISPTVRLTTAGYIKSVKLRYSPESINFGALRKSESGSKQVYIPSPPEESIEIKNVSSDIPFVTASPALKEETNIFVTITLKPGAPVGELNGKLTIESNHPKQPKVEIPITATIRGDISLDRDSLFFGMMEQGMEGRSAITISTVGDKPLNIKNVDNPLDYMSVTVSPKTEGKEYILSAVLKKDAPVGNIKGEITIHTDDTDQPEIKVPVYAYITN